MLLWAVIAILGVKVGGSYGTLYQDWQKLISNHRNTLTSNSLSTASGISGNQLLDVAQAVGETELVAKIHKCGLTNTYNAPGPLTVFGPTNAAYSSVPSWVQRAINKDTRSMQYHLKYHTVGQAIYSSQFQNEMLIRTLTGDDLRMNIYKNGSVFTVGGCEVTLMDRNASNGVIHEISKVMIAPEVTIGQMVNKNKHVEIANKALWQVPALKDMLNGTAPYTMFVPSNDAFDALPPGSLNYILSNPALLKEILSYHIVSGTHFKAGLSDGDQLMTLEGEPITVTESNGHFSVNGVQLHDGDFPMINGCVHYMSKVLLPPSLSR